MGRMYSATFDNVAVSAAQDLFEITAGSTNSVVIHGWEIGQATDYGDAQAEGKRLQLVRGHTTSGSGGTTATAASLVSGGAAAASAVEVNNTTIASAGTGVLLFASAWNIQAGHEKWFTPETRPTVPAAGRIVLRSPDAPTDVMTMSGTIWFEEI